MKQSLRGFWLKDKKQNLIMLLRYNKDNLFYKDKKVIVDCGMWYVRKWKYNKIGLKGVIEIEFNNDTTLILHYYTKKKKIINENPIEYITMSSLLEEIIPYEKL